MSSSPPLRPVVQRTATYAAAAAESSDFSDLSTTGTPELASSRPSSLHVRTESGDSQIGSVGSESPSTCTQSAPITPAHSYARSHARTASNASAAPFMSVTPMHPLVSTWSPMLHAASGVPVHIASNLVPPTLTMLQQAACRDTATGSSRATASPHQHRPLRMLPIARSSSGPIQRDGAELDDAAAAHLATQMHTHRQLPPSHTHHHLHSSSAQLSASQIAAVRKSSMPNAQSAVSASRRIDPERPRGTPRSRSPRPRSPRPRSRSPRPQRSRAQSRAAAAAADAADAATDGGIISPPPSPHRLSELGGAEPETPTSYLQHLSASFIERIPLSLQHSTLILAPNSILNAPLIDPTRTPLARGGDSPSSRKLSLAEMALEARQTKKRLRREARSTLAARRIMSGLPPTDQSRRNSIVSPGQQLQQPLPPRSGESVDITEPSPSAALDSIKIAIATGEPASFELQPRVPSQQPQAFTPLSQHQTPDFLSPPRLEQQESPPSSEYSTQPLDDNVFAPSPLQLPQTRGEQDQAASEQQQEGDPSDLYAAPLPSYDGSALDAPLSLYDSYDAAGDHGDGDTQSFRYQYARSADLEMSSAPAMEHISSVGFHDSGHAERGLGTDPVSHKDEDQLVHVFLEEVGSALFSCGLPLHIVEFFLILIAHRLNVDITIVAISTQFWICFPPSSTAHMVVAKKPGLSLRKMVDICGVCEQMLHGMFTPVEGLAQLQSIMRSKPPYAQWVVLPAMMFTSFFYAPLFNSGWVECVVAAISGGLIGLLEIYSESHASISRGHDLLSGLLAGVLAVLCYSYITKINLLAAVFGGIVWCLPGLRVTLSMLDLSTGNPVTGTAKFMSSIITAVNLGIGVVAGISLGQFTGMDDSNILASSSYGTTPEWFIPICIIGSAFPSIILLDAKMNHFGQYLAGSAVAYYLSSYATNYIGQAFGSWIAAAGVGVIGNIYGRVTQYPAIELVLFSILMLVPGSIGVRSVLADDTLSTVGFLTQMITVAIAIVTGLFTANVIVPPLRAL